MIRRICSLIVTVMLLLTIPAITQAAWSYWTLYDLGPQGAKTISKEGLVIVGTINGVAYRFNPNPGPIGALPGGNFSEAYAAEGFAGVKVAGDSNLASSRNTHGFVADQSGMKDLGGLGGQDGYSTAYAINADDVCGIAADPTLLPDPTLIGENNRVPVCWTTLGLFEYPTLGGPQGRVTAINEIGNAAGESQVASGTYHCTYWPVNGGVYDCHSPLSVGDDEVMDINSQNGIVGNTQIATGPRGFMVLPMGVVMLQLLPQATRNVGRAINDLWMVVGESYTPDPAGCCRFLFRAATLWENNVAIDLQPLVLNIGSWTLTRAIGIDNDQNILAEASLNGVVHSVLLYATDNPAVSKIKYDYRFARHYEHISERWWKQAYQHIRR